MTTKNRTGSKGAFGNSIQSLDDRLRQLQSITPGSDGGGSVAAPFKIGDHTFGPGQQVDTNKLADIARPGDRWDGAEYRPILSQGSFTANISYDLRYSEVLRGDEWVWNFWLDVTGAGTAGEWVVLSLPTLAFRTGPCFIGQGQIYDLNTTTRYGMEIESTDSGASLAFGGDSTGGSLWGVAPSLALAAGDQVRGMVRYRPRISA